MLKTLISKQVHSIGASMFNKSAMGKKKGGTGGQKALYVFLLLYIVGFFAYLFSNAFLVICPALVDIGLDSLYFTYIGVLALSLTIVFTMFMAKSQLFESKDNELLLSLPIKPSYILVSRMLVFVAENVLTILYIFVIGLIIYAKFVELTAGVVICSVVMCICLTLLSTLVSCLIGFAVARVTAGMKNKSLFTVIFSLIFIAAYFYGYSQLQTGLTFLTEEAQEISVKLGFVNIIGEACIGDGVKLLIVLGVSVVLGALMLYVLSANYIRIITTQKGFKKTAYKAGKLETSSAFTALVKRELLHFTKSATYMLNCGLGIVFMLIGIVAVIIKGGAIRELALSFDVFKEAPGLTTGIIIAIICFVNTLNNITAPIISLEGKSFWIVRSLPLKSFDILRSKLCASLVLTLPGTVLASVVLCVTVGVGPLQTVLTMVATVLYVIFYELFGLNSNLKHYSLDWDNEAYPVKQGFSCVATLFGGWGIVMLIFGISIMLIDLGGGLLAGIVVTLVLAVCVILAYSTLKTKGLKRFEQI